jgi:uncharacterized protein YabE (DUF348 family)
MTFIRTIKSCFSLKESLIILLTILISIAAGIGVFFFLKKEVKLIDNGKQITFDTMSNTVGEVLKQRGISLKPYDFINLPAGSILMNTATNKIIIKRAVPVFVSVDGSTKKVMTCADNVSSALDDASVKLGIYDRLEDITLESPVVKDMIIKIIRVKKEYVTEKMFIPYDTEKKANDNVNRGMEKIIQEGEEGVREVSYLVIFEDGFEVSRELFLNKLVSEPVNHVIEYGTVPYITTSTGDIVRYREVLDMRATAYTSSFKDTGKHPDHPEFGITYTGLKAEVGIIAVDPDVIPLHTKVYVEMPGDMPDYGFALAADIGGAIKGDLIDLYMDTQQEVDKWGCKKCKVYILYD